MHYCRENCESKMRRCVSIKFNVNYELLYLLMKTVWVSVWAKNLHEFKIWLVCAKSSVTRSQDYFSTFGHLGTSMKIRLMAYKFCQSRSNNLPNSKLYLKKCQRLSPNLVTRDCLPPSLRTCLVQVCIIWVNLLSSRTIYLSKNFAIIHSCSNLWRGIFSFARSSPHSLFVEPASSQFCVAANSVTRLGDLLHFGQPFKAFENNNFAQISYILSQFL